MYVCSGTGKSKTGALIAYLLAKKEKILFCGPTNTAVDTVASKLESCLLHLTTTSGTVGDILLRSF